jgi:hypothetical protein
MSPGADALLAGQYEVDDLAAVRMARVALGLGGSRSAAAKVSIDTVARFERGDELKERTIDALQRALEAAGRRVHQW